MIKLNADEYDNLISKMLSVHEHAISFINGYLTEMHSILNEKDGFHAELSSEGIEIMIKDFQGQLLPELIEQFNETDRLMAEFSKSITEVDEEGGLKIQWEK